MSTAPFSFGFQAWWQGKLAEVTSEDIAATEKTLAKEEYPRDVLVGILPQALRKLFALIRRLRQELFDKTESHGIRCIAATMSEDHARLHDALAAEEGRIDTLMQVFWEEVELALPNFPLLGRRLATDWHVFSNPDDAMRQLALSTVSLR